MASEARITINDTLLSEQESMTVRLAVDALKNILSEQSASGEEPIPLTAISRVQALLARGAPTTPSVN